MHSDNGHPDLGPNHRCRNAHGGDIQPGQICHTWARLHLAGDVAWSDPDEAA
jgi:hypothetical protein